MENKKMAKPRSCGPVLSTFQASHTITKEIANQQAIRIIHIFAPKVIKMMVQISSNWSKNSPKKEVKLIGSSEFFLGSREFKLEAPLPTMKEEGERWKASGSSFFDDFDRLIATVMHNGDSSSSLDTSEFPQTPLDSSHHDLLTETHMS
ncbi:hypothetical protein AMTRI_Chr02g216750 [Amborella trichopoda]